MTQDTGVAVAPDVNAPKRDVEDVKSHDAGNQRNVEQWMYIKCIVSEDDEEIMSQPPMYRTAAGAD